MVFKELRNKLLQKAITGQLVPQLDSEPAVEQLDPAPKPEDVPFAIPEKWTWVHLEQLCSYIQRGKSPKYSEIKQYPVIAQKCNQWDGLHMELALFIDPATIGSYTQERFLQNNDVLINSTGTGTLGRVGLYNTVLNPYDIAVADSHVTVVRANHEQLVPIFLKLFLSTSDSQSLLIELGSGSTNQKELSLAKLRNFPIPLPPLAEQQRIVAKLKPLLEELDAMERAYTELSGPMYSHFKDLILQKAISGQLVPQLDIELAVEQLGATPATEDVPFAIPEKWKWFKFDSCLKLISGRDLSSNQILDSYIEGALPYLTGASQVSNGALILNRWTNAPAVISKQGDLLITCKGTVGKLAFNTEGSMHIARQIMAIRPLPSNSCLSIGFCRLLLEFWSAKITAKAKGLIPGITRQDLLQMWLPVPPLAEQKRIVERVEAIFAEADKLLALKELSL